MGAAHASAGETASTVNAELDGLGVHVAARRTRPCSASRMALAEGLLLLHALLLLGSSAWSIKHPYGPASDVSGPAEAACSGGRVERHEARALQLGLEDAHGRLELDDLGRARAVHAVRAPICNRRAVPSLCHRYRRVQRSKEGARTVA